jgi:tRNA-binding EMAP/Myf-like protein
MPDINQYKVGVVLSIEECGSGQSNKSLRSCRVNVGDEGNPITVVTAATNVREGSRLVPQYAVVES